VINYTINQDQRAKTLFMKAATDRHSNFAILLYRYNMFRVISFTNFSDDSDAIAVTGNAVPRFIASNDTKSLFIRSVGMLMGSA
jgi:hypothetical protein